MYPLLVVSQTIPAIVFAPILIVWLGFGLLPKIVVVALVAFFPVVVSTVDGLVNADVDLVDLVHSFGGGRWQRLRLVQAPVGAAVVLRRAEDRRDVRGDRRGHRGVDGRVRGARTRDDPRVACVPHRPRVRGGRRGGARQPRPVLDRPARGAPRDTVAVGVRIDPKGNSLKRSIVVGFVLALLVAAACGGNGDSNAEASTSSEGRNATLVLNWTPNTHHIGVYAAQQLGWYRDAGIDLHIIEPTADGAEKAVGTGAAQFGVSMAEGVLPARASGIPIVSIGTILPVNDSALMSLAGEGITTPADLEGKTYGGYSGPLETELINRLAECGGIDPASVKHTDVGNVDYLAGLEANRFDVVWIFAGWDAFARQ